MTLAVAGLSFAYPRHPVLRDVHVSPSTPGALTVLIGPNATGKSTLFRCLAGLLAPAAGTIALEGVTRADIGRRAWNERVCFVPQSFACRAALSVFDVVLLARKHLEGRGVADADVAAVEALLQRLGIEHLAEKYVGDLSGGQQQIVSIAQALVRSPRLFLLDEPTSALDLRHQLEIMTTISDVTHERGITAIVALHDLNLAARFADTLLLMREGHIVAEGKPADVLASEHVASTYAVDIELQRTAGGLLGVAASLRDAARGSAGLSEPP